LAFHLQKFALLTPCLRQTSAVFPPLSCSRSIPMIYSSVNLDRVIGPSPLRHGRYQVWRAQVHLIATLVVPKHAEFLVLWVAIKRVSIPTFHRTRLVRPKMGEVPLNDGD
jgi:hypothetical protein